MVIVKVENIHKVYKIDEISVNALKNINFDIEMKTFISFIGPSGSGKTTLLNLLGCIDKPSSGDIYFNNIIINKLNKNGASKFRSENIGFIFQNFNLIPVLTVYENVEYPLILLQNLPKKERKVRVLSLLEKVGMLDQKDKFPNQISGGQKQRVAVARALINNPKIVLADEPTANLDHTTAYKIIEIMREMKNIMNTTFIFSTHDPKIVGEAEIIYTLEDGIIVNKEVKR